MHCTECEAPVDSTTVVTFITGKTEALTLCADCKAEYRQGAFVSAVAEEEPETGGDAQHIAKCADCGEVYPTQSSPEHDLRPVGLEDGTCVCGGADFRPLVEK